ncbi:MAG TPA: hypothetical protein VKR53_01560 [Puia sp.]|nr:hypothetical protein [Puia sp.]
MSKKIQNIIIIIVIIFITILFFWSGNYFSGGESDISEPSRIICKKSKITKEEECFWTAHIHSKLKILKGNKEIPLGYEKGNLSRNHTHSQKGINHWHGLIKVDKDSKQVLDWSDFKIELIPKDFEINFKEKPKFIVNNKQVEQDYIWKDKDGIEIYYE